MGCWDMIFGGLFSIKKVYHMLLGNFDNVGWRCLIGNNLASPRAVFCVLLMVQGRLPTIHRICKRGINLNPICELCRDVDDSHANVFHDCSYLVALKDFVLKSFSRIDFSCSFKDEIGMFFKLSRKKY